MRIPSTETRQGYFWLPTDPGEQLPGTLTIRDGGVVELDVMGAFKGHNPLGPQATIDRIVGSVEKHGYVTLDRCFYRNWSLASPGIMKGTLFVHRALLGVGHDANEPVLVDEFRFSVEGLEEWLGLTGIDTAVDLAKRTATITYVPQEEIKLELNNGLQLAFGLSYSLPGSPSMTGAKITQKAFLRLAAKELRPIEDFIVVAHRLTNFFCFAVDETVTMDAVSAMTIGTPRDASTPPERLEMKVIYQSMPFSERPLKVEWHTMLFRFAHIRDGATAVIPSPRV